MPKLISQTVPVKDNANRTVLFPIIGEATFDEQGQLEVKDEQVEEFINFTESSFNFAIVGAPKKEKDKSVDDESADLQEYKELLNEATETEILELIRDCGDDDFKSVAAGMTHLKRKNGLIRLFKERQANGKN